MSNIDIDELPTWLSAKVDIAIMRTLLYIENIENENSEVLKILEAQKKALGEKWKFIKIIFESSSLKPDWEKLSTYSQEELNSFISQIFNLPHNWKEQLELEKRRKKYDENLRKSINKLINAKKDLDKFSLYKSSEVEKAWKLIESRLRDRLFEMDKKYDPTYADYYFSSFLSPITRKKNVQNAHALYCMKHLSITTRSAFNKPLNEVVANFINAIFGTEYTYNDVVGYTKDIKSIFEKLNDVTIPFSATVDRKTGKMRSKKSVDSKA